jgi:cation transport regulator ChaC
MFYFAYGSNLTHAQLSKRCPSAHVVCRALLPNYRLAFTRFVESRSGGVADVVTSPGSEVWGVVYQIADTEVADLDRAEGYRAGRDTNVYDRVHDTVEREGRADDTIPVELYVVEKKENHHRPAESYKALIVNGAREQGLPLRYIEQLEQIEALG